MKTKDEREKDRLRSADYYQQNKEALKLARNLDITVPQARELLKAERYKAWMRVQK